MRRTPKAVQVVAIAAAATAMSGAGLASAHASSGAATKVANVAPVAAKESAVQKAVRSGAKMMKNKGTGKCLRAVGNDLKLAKCNRRDGNQYHGQWGGKIYFPDFGCVSANRRTWDVRVEDCSHYSNHGYVLTWTVLWGSKSYNTVWNSSGCYLEGGNKGNFVRCSPGSKGNNKRWQYGLWG